MSTSRSEIRAGLVVAFDDQIVDELLDAYASAKENFYLGGLRLSEVEGGRFCEAAFRLLEQRAFGGFTRIGATLDADALIRRLANLSSGTEVDSVRLHMPRALRVVYDVRNNRDAAHLADGIDPNLQDAALVIGVLDWVMAEFVRLHHDVGASHARKMVEDLVTRKAPVIQDFDGFLKLLRTDLTARESCLVILYQRGNTGAAYHELLRFVRTSMRANLRRTLTALVHDKAWIHQDQQLYTITRTGQQEVEAQGWLTL